MLEQMGLTGKLTIDEIAEIMGECKGVDCFIETGTYKAESTLEAAAVFAEVHSIEISEDLYRAASEKCAGSPNICLYHGDSLLILSTLCDRVNALKTKAMWFLDAHQSGPDTQNNGTHVPLLEELRLIARDIENLHGHIFVIDDARLFNAYWDWVDVTQDTIFKIFSDAGAKVHSSYVKNDRLVIYV